MRRKGARTVQRLPIYMCNHYIYELPKAVEIETVQIVGITDITEMSGGGAAMGSYTGDLLGPWSSEV